MLVFIAFALVLLLAAGLRRQAVRYERAHALPPARPGLRLRDRSRS